MQSTYTCRESAMMVMPSAYYTASACYMEHHILRYGQLANHVFAVIIHLTPVGVTLLVTNRFILTAAPIDISEHLLVIFLGCCARCFSPHKQ